MHLKSRENVAAHWVLKHILSEKSVKKNVNVNLDLISRCH